MKSTSQQIIIDGLEITLVRKNVKNLNLVVYPPDGRVRVSAPRRTSEAIIRQVVQARMAWIKRQQARFAGLAERSTPQFANGEEVDFLGKTYLLNINNVSGRPKVSLSGGQINLQVPAGYTADQRVKTLENWYRAQLKQLIPQTIALWEPVLDVKVAEWGVKRMKTKWGTCNTRARRIWLNLELVKLPPEYLEYVVVHEMTHLLERTHSARFHSLLDQAMPGWRKIKQSLNQSVKQNGRLRMG